MELGAGSWEELSHSSNLKRYYQCMQISSFRDLDVWNLGMLLAEEVYSLTASFPTSEHYGLTGQMRSAAVSIPSNIAEGHNRGYTKEYLRFLGIAQGSLAELETQLELALRLSYLTHSEAQTPMRNADLLGKQIRTLQKSLSGRR